MGKEILKDNKMNFLAKLGIGTGVIVGVVIIVIIVFGIAVIRYVKNDKQFEYEE